MEKKFKLTVKLGTLEKEGTSGSWGDTLSKFLNTVNDLQSRGFVYQEKTDMWYHPTLHQLTSVQIRSSR